MPFTCWKEGRVEGKTGSRQSRRRSEASFLQEKIFHLKGHQQLSIAKIILENIEQHAGNVKSITMAASCSVCSRSDANYICPRCNARYCSVNCYKNHSTQCTDTFYR
jgi:hypothetical protein